jgi:hypothetical protein
VYKAKPHVGDSWQVVWESSKGSRPIDGQSVFPYRQGAYRKIKALNNAILGECKECGEPADVQCKIGTCAPRSLWCGYHYEQEHLPIEERDSL